MTLFDKLSRQLLTPPITGKRAAWWAIVAVAVPTIIRAALDGIVEGLPYTAYLPFVIFAVIMLEWRYAAAVALCSAFVADFLFVEPRYHLAPEPSELFGVGVFIATAALMLGVAEGVRRIIDNSLRPARPDGVPAQVVFSLEDGQAWASWYGSHSWVRLGPEDEVAEMMEDFLAQRELGQRLAKQNP